MKKFTLLLLIFVILLPNTIFANDAKDYIPAPAGTDAILFYFDHISGTDSYLNGNKVSSSADLTGNIAVFRYAHYGQIGKFPWLINALVPYGEMSLDNVGATNQKISTSQIGDLVAAASIWPISNISTRTWLGLSQYVIFPTGDYDNTKPVGLQLGQNRWSFKEEIGFTQGIGPFMIDLQGFVQFFSNNGDFTSAGLDLERDPLWHGEAHLIWDVNKTFFLSADYFYENGGESNVKGGPSNNDKLDDHTAGLTVGYSLTPSSQILLKCKKTFKTENGIENTDIGFRFAFFF